MSNVKLHLLFLMCLCLFGALSSGWATIWNVPAPNGTDDTTNIQNTINGSASGDTISFSTGGQYKVSSQINILGSHTYTGNGCTLNWISTTAGSLIYLNAVSNLSIAGFIFNGSANGGNVYFNPVCSYVTFTNNTIENDSYSGSNWTLTEGIMIGSNASGGLTNSSITFNTIHNVSGNGIMIYSPNNDTFSNNTFSNLNYDCMQIGGMLGGCNATGIVFQGNVGTNNCNRVGIEIGDGDPGGGTYPSTTNMLIDSNIFSEGFNATYDNTEMDISVVNAGTGTVISNNNLTLTNPQSWASCVELASDLSDPENAHITHNTLHDAPWAFCWDGYYNENVLLDYNLIVNMANSPVWDDGTTTNCGGSADRYQYNWTYGCTNDLGKYPNNSNLSGACPTMSISGAQNGADGTFTITSSLAPSQNTTVTYAVSGTGVPGTDYQTLSGSATINSGQTSVTIPVTHLNSNHGYKTVIATLTFGPYYINSASKSATVTVNTTPIPTTNLNLWLIGDNGVTQSGGVVSAWADQSGNGLNASQGTSTYRPTYVTSSMNGHAIVRFNGSNNYLNVASGFANFTSGVSIFVVAKPSYANWWDRFIDFGTGSPTNNLVFARNGNSNTLSYETYNGSWSDLDATNAIPVNTAYVLEVVQSSSGSTSIYKNGTSLSMGTVTLPTNVTRTQNYIAKSDGGSDGYYEGDIAEIIIYNSALSTTNRQTVETYLRTKYGL